jgi:hypothetical protein
MTETPRAESPGTLEDTSHITDVPLWTPAEEQPTLSDKDESAVAGLLALGMNDSSMDLLEPPTSKIQMFPTLSPAFSPRMQTENTSTGIQTLLRHYRYEIAPWVRHICPENLLFGRGLTDRADAVGHMRFGSIFWHQWPSASDELTVHMERNPWPIRDLL